MAKRKIYLIRHGQTDWNAERKIQGSTDIVLNEAGRHQAAALAKGMERRPVAQIFSSPLKRALETAQAIGRTQKVKVQTLEGLKEVNFGVWEGLTLDEIEKTYPKENRQWLKDPTSITPPKGETREELKKRSAQAVQWILDHMEGDVAVVAHGAIMAYLIEYLMRKEPDHKAIIVKNASITTLEYDPDSERMVLAEENDVSHLA